MLEFLAAHKPGHVEWLLLSATLFAIGLYGVLTRRNAVGILISVELMLNSAALNFVVFNRFVAPAACDGQITAIFVIAVAAAEVGVGLAIIMLIYRNKASVDLDQLDEMKG